MKPAGKIGADPVAAVAAAGAGGRTSGAWAGGGAARSSARIGSCSPGSRSEGTAGRTGPRCPQCLHTAEQRNRMARQPSWVQMPRSRPESCSQSASPSVSPLWARARCRIKCLAAPRVRYRSQRLQQISTSAPAGLAPMLSPAGAAPKRRRRTSCGCGKPAALAKRGLGPGGGGGTSGIVSASCMAGSGKTAAATDPAAAFKGQGPRSGPRTNAGPTAPCTGAVEGGPGCEASPIRTPT